MKDTTRSVLVPLLQSDDSISAEQVKSVLAVLSGEPAEPLVPREPEPYLTLKEAAKLLGFSPCTLWRWEVPGHDLAGRRRFRVSEIEAYLHSEAFQERAERLREERRG